MEMEIQACFMLKAIISHGDTSLLSSSWSRSWSWPGPNLVLPWTYHGQVPFLVKTGPGVDTIIKQPTHPPPHPTHQKLF